MATFTTNSAPAEEKSPAKTVRYEVSPEFAGGAAGAEMKLDMESLNRITRSIDELEPNAADDAEQARIKDYQRLWLKEIFRDIRGSYKCAPLLFPMSYDDVSHKTDMKALVSAMTVQKPESERLTRIKSRRQHEHQKHSLKQINK